MRIGIDASRAVTSQRTGTEAYAFFLINALIPLAEQAGHTIQLYFNQPPPAGLFEENTAVSQTTIPFPRLWTHLRLAAELHQHPPDIFFTPAHVLPATYFGKSIATVHDLAYHHFPEAYTKRQRAYLKWSTRHNARRSRIVLADSQATKTDLYHFYNIDPTKIEVLYPGIDPALKPVKDEAAVTAVLQKHNITPPYLLYLSTLQPRKNLVRLIQAHAAANVPHQLVLAGKAGWLSQPILEAVSSQQSAVSSQQSVLLPGFIDDLDKSALISGATAVLYPSLYEGFGFPILEAQACGVPVLTANTSSLPEVAGDAALYVDPHDTNSITHAIQKIVQDAPLRQNLVTAGFTNVQKFNWKKTAVNLLQILEKAAENNEY
ncbi:MAG: glycosyltransferase family 1 protein [Chloroflexi bacterium]|nr:MAG: glycosyltransferase family 1 protein [Chloroflexota bacterium]